MIFVTGNFRALAQVTAITRLKLFDERRFTLRPTVEEDGAYPIPQRGLGLIVPVRPAGKTNGLPGEIIPCNRI
jgi:hypothetical protein